MGNKASSASSKRRRAEKMSRSVDRGEDQKQAVNTQLTYKGAFVGVGSGDFKKRKGGLTLKEGNKSGQLVSDISTIESSPEDKKNIRQRDSYMSRLGISRPGRENQPQSNMMSVFQPPPALMATALQSESTVPSFGNLNRISVPKRLQRAVSAGNIVINKKELERQRKLMSYREKTFFGMEGGEDNPEQQKEDVMSDEDEEAQKIEIVEGALMDFEIPKIMALPVEDFALSRQASSDEQLYESFTVPEVDGFSLDFISKNRTNDSIRRNFLSKLTYQKIWLTPLQQPKLHETAIIFDWDDTLLCTSFINPSGYYRPTELPQAVLQQIAVLEETCVKILTLSLHAGKVFIITNAAEGWVEFSAQKFMPSVAPFLERITIISARTKYEHHFPQDVSQWKLHAFLETQQIIEEAAMTNIVALGDSMMELDAAHHLAQKFNQAFIKTVKFREFPKPSELVKQLNLVIQKFNEIVHSPKNLTIRLEKKKSD